MFVEVRNTGANIAVKLFEYVVVFVSQIGQKIFLAGDKIETLHVEHEGDANE